MERFTIIRVGFRGRTWTRVWLIRRPMFSESPRKTLKKLISLDSEEEPLVNTITLSAILKERNPETTTKP
jgi:hypothetical protein